MPRYCVNATVALDAWTYLEADTIEDAREQACTLEPTEFETGDPFDHDIVSVELDA